MSFPDALDHGVDGVVDQLWLLDVVRRTLDDALTIGAMTDLAVAFGQAHEVVAVGVRLNARRQRRRVERCAVIEHRRRRPRREPLDELRRSEGCEETVPGSSVSTSTGWSMISGPACCGMPRRVPR